MSVVDLSAHLNKASTKEEVSQAFRDAANGDLNGILDVEDESLVSTDFNHNPYSAIIDFPMISVVDQTSVKILACYDNEWAFSNRLAEIINNIWELENE